MRSLLAGEGGEAAEPVRLLVGASALVLLTAVALGVAGASAPPAAVVARAQAGAPGAAAPGAAAPGTGAPGTGAAETGAVEAGAAEAAGPALAGGAPAAGPAELPSGTALDDGAYRLEVGRTVLPARERVPFSFRLLDRAGRVVRAADVDSGAGTSDGQAGVRLVLVDRELRRTALLRPVPSADGSTWTHPLQADPGAYRAVVSFAVDGRPHALGVDLAVPGPLTARPLPAPADAVTVDGYEVRLARGSAGVALSVRRDGVPVALDPAVPAELVALRAGDLAVAPVRPYGPTSFRVPLGPGTWRLFLQFVPADGGGKVRTAAFTVQA